MGVQCILCVWLLWLVVCVFWYGDFFCWWNNFVRLCVG